MHSSASGSPPKTLFKPRAPGSAGFRLRGLRVAAFALVAALAVDTANAANCVSAGSGTWTGITWTNCAGGPAAGDTVMIQGIHTVALNTSPSITSLSVAGTLTFGNNNTARTLTVSGNVTNTGTINISANNNVHTFNIGGNISNSGNLDFWDSSARATNVTLNGAAPQTISGAGTFTFNIINANNSASFAAGVTASVVGSITIGTGRTVTNNGSITALNIVGLNATTSIWTQGANSSVEISGSLMTLGVLNASANGNTVYYNANAAQAIKLPTGGDYFHLKLGGGNTKTFAASTYDVLGALTLETGTILDANTNAPVVNVTGNTSIAGTYSGSATAALTMTGDLSVTGTYTGNGGAANLAGNFSRSGTFTSGAGVFTFNSTTAVQTISGSPAFTNLTINNTGGGIALNSDVTATVSPGTGTLILQNGIVATGAFNLITSRNCSGPSVSRTNGWVNGNLRKAIPAGASTCTFEIGDGTTYAPVVMVFAATTTAGTLTGKATAGDHPSISSASIQANDSVNRYWTFTAGGALTVPGGYAATFNFPSTDADNAGAIGTYVVQQWNGTLWFPTTLAASCTATPATHVCKQITGELQFGDFAIGGVAPGFNSNPGAFNVFETTTASGSILGRIYTKVAGETLVAPRNLAIVAVSNNGVNPSPSATNLTVDVIDASDNSGALNTATNCRSSWPSGSFVQRQTVTASWTSGRLTFTLTTPTQALRDGRIRVTQGALVGCSTDRFSIRPDTFTISSSANNSASAGTPAIKTGADFTITAQPITKTGAANITAGYDGAPNFDNSKLVVPLGWIAGTIQGSFNAATGGAASGTGFYYNEVGNFGLAADAATDNTFTGVDQTTDCNAGSSSNTVDGAGKVGCSIGSAATANPAFGRFIPDNFDVSLNNAAVRLGAACGTFTYVGQRFAYTVAPVITVTARSGNNHSLGNTTTRNYAGVYMKLSNTSLAAAPYAAQTDRYSRFDAGSTPALSTSSGFPATSADPAISFPGASVTSGVGTLTFSSGAFGEGFLFTRSTSTPASPFDADIKLALNVVDGDGVTYASNPVAFGAASSGGGISFTGGKTMRYGIVRLQDAYAPLSGTGPVTIRAEYWNGSAFVLNTSDNCTSFTEKNFVLHTHGGSITSTNLPSPTAGSNGKVSMGVATLSSGVGRVDVINPSLAPAPINTITAPGNVRICLDLDGASPNDNTCVAPTPADLSHLQGRWAPSSYNRDPYGTVGFGLYGAQPRNFIYMRENY